MAKHASLARSCDGTRPDRVTTLRDRSLGLRVHRSVGSRVWYPLVLTFLVLVTLNRGAAYVGLAPIYLAEASLIFYLLALRHESFLPRFASSGLFPFTVAAITTMAALALVGLVRDPWNALRHSVVWVHILWVYVGWAFGDIIVRRGVVRGLEKGLAISGVSVALYYCLFPLKAELRTATVYSQAAGEVALLGYYSTLHATGIGMVLVPALVWRSNWGTLASGLGLGLIVFVSQSRGALLATTAAILYASTLTGGGWVRSRAMRSAAIAASLALLSMLAGIRVQGQRGVAGLEQLTTGAVSILDDQGLEGLSGSRTDRILWWEQTLGETFGSIETSLTGLGMERVLLDRKTESGVPLRYPHNSFVTVLGHTGILGVSVYIALIASAMVTIARRSKAAPSCVLVQWYPLFAIGWLVSAFFSPVAEASFHSMPYWALTGAAYRLSSSEALDGLPPVLDNARSWSLPGRPHRERAHSRANAAGAFRSRNGR